MMSALPRNSLMAVAPAAEHHPSPSTAGIQYDFPERPLVEQQHVDGSHRTRDRQRGGCKRLIIAIGDALEFQRDLLRWQMGERNQHLRLELRIALRQISTAQL